MRTLPRGVFLCFQLMVFSLRLLAYSDWLPVSQDELKMTSFNKQPGAAAVVLYQEEIDDDTKHSQSIYTRIKILTEAGKEYANVEIPYDKNFLSIGSLKARTIQPDGTIVSFDGKTFDKTLLKANGVKWNAKTFTMPNVEVGSIIEYRYFRDYDEHWDVPPRWQLQGKLFRVKQYFSYVPTKHDVMMRHDVAGRGVSWTAFTPKGTALTENKFLNKFEVALTDTPAFVEEPDMPPANMYRYGAHFYYDLHQDTAAFWKSEGKFWAHDVDRFLGKHGGLAEAVQATVGANDAPEEKARKIYAFVQGLQNLDYTAKRSEIEMKSLGLKDARGVEDVLRQKMGDGEDLARLYLAMAKQAGLTASVIRVATHDDEEFFDERFLSFDQLDREIVVLKLPAGEVRLDPGVKYCPFGLLYWKHADTRGIRVAGKGTELVTVEGNTFKDSWLRRDADLKLNLQGKLDGTIRVTYQGQQALERRLENWKTDEAGKQKALEDEVKRWLPENAEISLMMQPKWDSTEDMLAIFRVTTPGASTAGKRILVPLDIMEYGRQPRFPHAERTWPISFNYPYRTSDHVQITLPAGYTVEDLPAASKSQLNYASYMMDGQMDGGRIDVMRDLAMAGRTFAKESYAELKGFYDKVKTGDETQAVLKSADASK